MSGSPTVLDAVEHQYHTKVENLTVPEQLSQSILSLWRNVRSDDQSIRLEETRLRRQKR